MDAFLGLGDSEKRGGGSLSEAFCEKVEMARGNLKEMTKEV